MINIYLIALCLVLTQIFAGCQTNNNRTDSDTTSVATDDLPGNEFDFGYIGQDSPNWVGAYTGVLPCDDCQGIQILITLEYDGKSHCSIKILGTDDDGETGVSRARWEQDGKTVWIRWYDGDYRRYRVGDNVLIQLDENGNPHTGPNAHQYILRKID